MNLACTRCSAAIPAEDVNLDNRLAKCRACNAVFDFSAQLATAGERPLEGRRAAVPMPPGITIVEDSGGDPFEGDYRVAPEGRGRLVLSRSWYTPQLFFFLFFCIAWDAFLVFWYATATQVPGPFSVIATVFPIAHVAVGVGLTYRTLAGFVNRTRITVTPEMLVVRHAPLPWLGNRKLEARRLSQLFCEQVVTQGSKGGSTTTYTLSAVLKDGTKLPLLKSLPSADQALYIEQRVEEKLGIDDAPVGGEYRG